MRGEKSVAAIVVAAGSGERAALGAASEPKQYRRLAGVPVLAELRAHDVSRAGERIALDIDLSRVSLFDAGTEKAL